MSQGEQHQGYKEQQGKTVFLADGAMLMAAFFWGSGFGVTDRLLDSCSPLWLLAFRFVPSGILLSLVFWKRLRGISRKNLIRGSLLGGFLFLVFLAHIYGLVFSTPGKQSLSHWGQCGDRPLSLRPGLSNLALKMCLHGGRGLPPWGFSPMAFTPGMQFNLGDSFSLILAFGVAMHCILVGNLTRKMDSCALAALQISGGGGLFSGLRPSSGAPFPPLPRGGADLLWGIPYVALFVTVIPFLIQTVAQRYSPEVHGGDYSLSGESFRVCHRYPHGAGRFASSDRSRGVLILAGVFLAELETYFARRHLRAVARQENSASGG